LDTYFARYTGVRDYMDNIKAQAKEDKYVETIMGRRLYLNEINAGNGLRRQAAERAAINAPLQGSAADIIKKAMLDIDELLSNEMPDVKMIMQVHDELVFECSRDNSHMVMEKMKEVMEQTVKLNIPLIAEAAIGSNWNEAH
ncbi:MAG: DNA polymerase I, partial [Gammaproteobacteria bacterium TMED234]